MYHSARTPFSVTQLIRHVYDPSVTDMHTLQGSRETVNNTAYSQFGRNTRFYIIVIQRYGIGLSEYITGSITGRWKQTPLIMRTHTIGIKRATTTCTMNQLMNDNDTVITLTGLICRLRPYLINSPFSRIAIGYQFIDGIFQVFEECFILHLPIREFFFCIIFLATRYESHNREENYSQIYKL